MLRSTALCLTLLSVFGTTSLPVAAATSAPPTDMALVDKAAAYLQGLRSAEAKFSQTDPRGAVTTGTFSLQRPGKARFAYDPRWQTENIRSVSGETDTTGAAAWVRGPVRQVGGDRGRITRQGRLHHHRPGREETGPGRALAQLFHSADVVDRLERSGSPGWKDHGRPERPEERRLTCAEPVRLARPASPRNQALIATRL